MLRFFAFLPLVLLAMCARPALAATQAHSTQKPTLKQARELMGSVCNGGAQTGECRVCPSFTNDTGFDDKMTLEGVTYGKFLNSKDTYALLDLSGCEPHANNFGGGVLLRWRGLTHWALVKYFPGLRSSDCQQYPAAGGRDLLLCRGDYEGMGIVDTSLFSLNFARFAAGASEPDVNTLFMLEDSREACLKTASAQSLLDWRSVRLGTGPGLRATVRSGFGPTGVTPDTCSDTSVKIPTRAYTLEYRFDGKAFLPTSSTQAALQRLLKDNPYLKGGS